MNVKGIWIGTSKNSSLHQIYRLSINQDERKDFIKTINLEKHFKEFEAKKSNIIKRNPNSLIEGDEYYINKINETNGPENLINFYNIVLHKDSNLKDKSSISFKQRLKKPDNKERERFYIIWVDIENKSYYLFIYINSRDIVRKRKLLDRSFSVNKNSAVIDVSHGIPIPEEITATYSFESEKLYIHRVYEFEKMLYLHEAFKEKASKQMKDFDDEKNTVSKESYKVSGLNKIEVKEKILGRVRYIRRIAEFDKNKSNYSIENIEKAVEMLPKEHEKVKFCHETKTITVNEDNVSTFVAIIHDSIVRRVISDEVVVI